MLREGPVLTVRAEPVLAVQELLRESGEGVPSVTLTALVDTGASGTLMQSAVFTQVGIEPFSFAYLRTPSTNERSSAAGIVSASFFPRRWPLKWMPSTGR